MTPAAFRDTLAELLELARQDPATLEKTHLAVIANALLETISQANLGLSGDLIHLAAGLIHLKSKLLLPGPQDEPGMLALSAPAFFDPDLLAAAASLLAEKTAQSTSTHSPPQPVSDDGSLQPDFTRFANLADYLALYRHVIDNGERRRILAVEPDPVSIDEMIAWLEACLPPGTSVHGQALFDQHPSRPAQIALFLGMLELGRRQTLSLDQFTDHELLVTRVAA